MRKEYFIGGKYVTEYMVRNAKSSLIGKSISLSQLESSDLVLLEQVGETIGIYGNDATIYRLEKSIDSLKQINLKCTSIELRDDQYEEDVAFLKKLRSMPT